MTSPEVETADPSDLHEQSAAESAPVVRRAAKFVTGLSALALWIAAIWMSVSAMLALTAGEPVYVVTGVIALALACDFWVGSAPIVLRSASAWGLKRWAWVGVVSLILALGMTTWNKISFWEGRSAEGAVRELQLAADPAAAARELLSAQPGARVPEAVQGELDGALGRRSAKRLEIDSLAQTPENEQRRRRSVRELGTIESEIGKLRGELATALAVATARTDVAAADAKALELRQADATKKPQPLWLHIALAVVHEALQLVMLSFATLRIPGHLLDAEVQRLILARKIQLKRRIDLVNLAMDEVRQLKTIKGIFHRQRKHLPSLAIRRADLEAARRLFDVELEEKQFAAERKLLLDGMLEPLPRELQIADQRANPPIESAPYKRATSIRDAETGEELSHVRGHLRKKTGKRGGVQTAELVPSEKSMADEPSLTAPDPRNPPIPEPLAAEAPSSATPVAEPVFPDAAPAADPEPESKLEPEPGQINLPDETILMDLLEPPAEPSLDDLLARGRSGELLSDSELERLREAGAIEQDEFGAWHEVGQQASLEQIAAE